MIITPEEAQRKLRAQADKAFRALILEAGKRIVIKTPVDTGRARGNWQVSVNVPSVQEMAEDAGGNATIMGISHDSRGVDIDNVVYIVNGVEYIQYLEDGTDKTPAYGMIKVTLEELQHTTNQVAAKVRASQ
jgi:hypothetical protein